jgi:hypothetical protein
MMHKSPPGPHITVTGQEFRNHVTVIYIQNQHLMTFSKCFAIHGLGVHRLTSHLYGVSTPLVVQYHTKAEEAPKICSQQPLLLEESSSVCVGPQRQHNLALAKCGCIEVARTL